MILAELCGTALHKYLDRSLGTAYNVIIVLSNDFPFHVRVPFIDRVTIWPSSIPKKTTAFELRFALGLCVCNFLRSNEGVVAVI